MKFFRMLLGSKKEKLSAEDERQVQDPPLEEGHEPQHPASEDTYWFFLSYFFNAQDIEKDKFIASWSVALGRPYKSVVKEFLDKGLIMQAGLKEKLGGMLRVRTRHVSGHSQIMPDLPPLRQLRWLRSGCHSSPGLKAWGFLARI